MKAVKINESKVKSVIFRENGGNANNIWVYVVQDIYYQDEYQGQQFLYELGSYSSMKSAVRFAAKKLSKMGMTFNI